MLAASSQYDRVADLRERLRSLEAARRPAAGSFSSGCGGLDRLLPDRGFRRGTLVEYLADDGSAAVALALVAAREACRERETLVIVDRGRRFYPPAAGNLGLDLTTTIFIHPRSRKDQLWALNQSLCCSGVGAVLAWPEKFDDRAFRALQLAAENGGAVGLFVRPICARRSPAWSELQLLVETRPTVAANRAVRIEVVRCRTGRAGTSVELELNDETGTLQEANPVHLAPALAGAAGASFTARA